MKRLSYDFSEPDWQPIETAPKDRPIWLFHQYADFETGVIRSYHRMAYWGIMRAYPKNAACWLPVGGDTNGQIPSEENFLRVSRTYEEHGNTRTLTHYRGTSISHWADIVEHSVTVILPDVPKPVFTDVEKDD